MDGQVFPAVVAIMLGVGAGLVLFVPFVAVQYRRQGRLTARQILLWAGFLIYGIALWTYTLLPLPDVATIRCLPAQLRPFQFLNDLSDSDYPIGSLSEIIRNPVVMQIALNVLLFIPLGLFLRIIWRLGLSTTVLIGLGVSLTIELTQLTGVWGIYPCAYRLFDADDLLANTFGALLGGALFTVLRFRSSPPTKQEVAKQPRPVTFWRRMLGIVCDGLAVGLIGSVAGLAVNLWLVYVQDADQRTLDPTPAHIGATLVPLVLIGALVLTTGRTLGDHAVLIRWNNGVRPLIVARLLRYLGGIGGWQVLVALETGLNGLFILATVIALVASKDRRGLPGLLSRMHPLDARLPAEQSHS